MASDVGAGDSEIVFLDVAPADGSTQVTLTVDPPSGSSYDVAMTGGDLMPIDDSVDFSQRWTSVTPVSYDAPGRWVLHYEVTGTGEGAEDLEVFVVASPVAGGPTWLPGRSRVAAYVPHRTLARSVTSTIESADTYQFTFDSTTVPDGVTVSRLIADGAAWVRSRVYPMNVGSEEAAGVCTALFAAAMVERSWPDDDQSLQRANDLERRLDVMLTDLVAANLAANTGSNTGIPVSPVWSFPQPDLRWDYDRYF
jgi:hypothetical protein